MKDSSQSHVPTLPMLIERWGEIVAEVELGYALTFDDYLNDMDLRNLIARTVRGVPPAARDGQEGIRDTLVALDTRFVSATEAAEGCIWGEANADDEGWSPDGEWWYFRLPMDRPEDW